MWGPCAEECASTQTGPRSSGCSSSISPSSSATNPTTTWRTQQVPLITGPKGERRARWGNWGFVPYWERGAKPKTRPINAKAESVASSGMVKFAFQERRCVVPASGFYEWTTEPDGKQPWLFARADRMPFALAGLRQRWTPPGGEPIDTFCVLTTPPNRVAGRVHDRMPAILPDREAVDLWLDPAAGPEDLQAILRPAPEDLLVMMPVSRQMNSPNFDTPEACSILEDFTTLLPPAPR